MTWKPDYTTVAMLKSELQIPADDTVDDVQLQRWVTSASRSVDDWAHRQFGKVTAPELRKYVAQWSRHDGAWRAEIDDLMDLEDLAVTYCGSAVDVDDLELWPLNAIAEGKAYTHVHLESLPSSLIGPTPWAGQRRRLSITASWGWTEVPVPVVQATLMQCSRLQARRSSPFGIAGSPAQGSELRLLEKLDVDAALVMHAYRRDWWAA